MNKRLIAKELIKIAEELLAMPVRVDEGRLNRITNEYKNWSRSVQSLSDADMKTILDAVGYNLNVTIQDVLRGFERGAELKGIVDVSKLVGKEE